MATSAPTAPKKYKIPQIVFTAARLHQQKFQEGLTAIANQGLEALGLNPADGWHVNFDTGEIARAPKQKTPAATNPSAPKKAKPR
jgi:hypothetical protein